MRAVINDQKFYPVNLSFIRELAQLKKEIDRLNKIPLHNPEPIVWPVKESVEYGEIYFELENLKFDLNKK